MRWIKVNDKRHKLSTSNVEFLLFILNMSVPGWTIAFVRKTRAVIKTIYELCSKQVKEAVEG